MTGNDLKEENCGREAGCCAHGWRIRKPVYSPMLCFVSGYKPLGGHWSAKAEEGIAIRGACEKFYGRD